MPGRYYLSMRQLDGLNYPSRIHRDNGITLHVVDPRASALEVHEASIDELDPWEHEAGRAAYGQSPPGMPLADELMEGMVMPFVPEAIRVPGEPPIQGEILTTPAYRTAYGRAFGWAINERWGNAETYRHPLPKQRQTAA